MKMVLYAILVLLVCASFVCSSEETATVVQIKVIGTNTPSFKTITLDGWEIIYDNATWTGRVTKVGIADTNGAIWQVTVSTNGTLTATLKP